MATGADKQATPEASEPPALETVTLQLSADALNALRAEAKKRNVSTGDMVRIAIGTHKFLSDAVDEGGKLVLRGRNGTFDVAI